MTEQTGWTLVFDGGCLSCSSIAEEVASCAEDRIKVRAFQDPEIQELLARAPGAPTDEPVLLHHADGDVEAYTGLVMRARLARIVGVRRTMRLLSALARLETPVPDAGRRRVLGLVSKSALGVAFAGTGGLAWATGKDSPTFPAPRPRSPISESGLDKARRPALRTMVDDLAKKSIDPDGSLRPGDFAWGRAGLVTYRDDGRIAVVPTTGKHHTELRRSFLLADPGASGMVLMNVHRPDDTQTDNYTIDFADLAGNALVGLEVDETKDRQHPVTYKHPYQEEQVLAAGSDGMVSAHPGCHFCGYWTCLGQCLEWAWGTLPWWVKVGCGGSFGACVFIGNPFACLALASCMGGIGSWCVAHC